MVGGNSPDPLGCIEYEWRDSIVQDRLELALGLPFVDGQAQPFILLRGDFSIEPVLET